MLIKDFARAITKLTIALSIEYLACQWIFFVDSRIQLVRKYELSWGMANLFADICTIASVISVFDSMQLQYQRSLYGTMVALFGASYPRTYIVYKLLTLLLIYRFGDSVIEADLWLRWTQKQAFIKLSGVENDQETQHLDKSPDEKPIFSDSEQDRPKEKAKENLFGDEDDENNALIDNNKKKSTQKTTQTLNTKITNNLPGGGKKLD
jgi:hypothetical protein